MRVCVLRTNLCPLHAAQGRNIKTLILPACLFHGIVLFGWGVASGLHPTHLNGVDHPAHFAFLIHRGEERTFVRRDVPQRNIHHFGAVESQMCSLNLERMFGGQMDKKSFVCLESKLVTPHRGNTVPLSIYPSNGFVPESRTNEADMAPIKGPQTHLVCKDDTLPCKRQTLAWQKEPTAWTRTSKKPFFGKFVRSYRRLYETYP